MFLDEKIFPFLKTSKNIILKPSPSANFQFHKNSAAGVIKRQSSACAFQHELPIVLLFNFRPLFS